MNYKIDNRIRKIHVILPYLPHDPPEMASVFPIV